MQDSFSIFPSLGRFLRELLSFTTFLPGPKKRIGERSWDDLYKWAFGPYCTPYKERDPKGHHRRRSQPNTSQARAESNGVIELIAKARNPDLGPHFDHARTDLRLFDVLVRTQINVGRGRNGGQLLDPREHKERRRMRGRCENFGGDV